ncbi:MAG: hypothetical protein R3F62_02700 [Planctomycetota bacterium]
MSPRGAAALLLLALGLGACASEDPVPPPPPAARCGYCADPLSDPEARTCASCRHSAVLDPAQADAVRRHAARALSERFGATIPAGVSLSLTLLSPEELRALAGPDAGPHLLAFTEVEELYRGELQVGRSFRIYLARETPAPWAAGILAHELFHVVQTLAGGGPTQEDAFREGAAQYVQHEVLQHLGAGRWAARVASDPDPIYGEGLRRFRALVLSRGERQALELARRAPRFPPGY